MSASVSSGGAGGSAGTASAKASSGVGGRVMSEDEVRTNERLRAEEEEEAAEGLKPADLKVILLGDSAVGKSKLVERFLMDDYHPRQRSTFALTLYRYDANIDGNDATVDFWDTAGQERFASMHPSYYYRAQACILVFDVTRKVTYTNLVEWYKELRVYCETIPVICVANKIDVDENVTKKAFQFPKKHDLPFYFVSAADGTNVVKVFQEAIKAAYEYKTKGSDFMHEIMELLDDDTLGGPKRGVGAAGTDDEE